MSNYIYTTVKDFLSCVSTQRTTYNHQKHLKLFPSSVTLEFFTMNVLEPLPKTTLGSKYIFAITYLYSKSTRPVPTSITTASHVASIFIYSLVIPYGIPKYLLTYNAPNFVGKLYTEVCGYLGRKKLKTTACHPQTNGQTEGNNNTIVARIRHYVY